MTSNETWIVAAARDERRFAVLDVGEARQRDARYFGEMWRQLREAGGLGKLLHLLRTFDLAGVDLREIPRTEALLEQKLESLGPVEGWWLDCLREGRIVSGHREAATAEPVWLDEVPCARLYDACIEHAGKRGASRRATQTQIGITLRRLAPGLRRRRGSGAAIPGFPAGGGDRPYVYELPTLEACRAAFAQAIGHPIRWEDEDEG